MPDNAPAEPFLPVNRYIQVSAQSLLEVCNTTKSPIKQAMKGLSCESLMYSSVLSDIPNHSGSPLSISRAIASFSFLSTISCMRQSM